MMWGHPSGEPRVLCVLSGSWSLRSPWFGCYGCLFQSLVVNDLCDFIELCMEFCGEVLCCEATYASTICDTEAVGEDEVST